MRRTNIGLFKDNIAHSNKEFGLNVIRNLGPGHTIIGCLVYSPRVNPLDRNTDFVVIKLGKFTGKLKKMHRQIIKKHTKFHFLFSSAFKNYASHAALMTAAVEISDWRLAC